MARTFISQPNQIFSSESYDDTQTVGQTMTGSLTLEQDLNNIRTQLRQILWANVSGSWYDAVTAPSGGLSARGLNTINDDLTDLEQKRLVYRCTNLNTVIVNSSSNFALLSVSNGTAPSDPIALGVTTQTGSIVAELVFAEGPHGTHSFALVSGTIDARPKNMAVVRDAFSGEPITDASNNNKDVYALLQIEEGATDGGAFNDTSGSHRTQLSFVVEDPSGSLVAASVAAIGGKHILYSYPCRTALDNIPEDAFLSDVIFLDAIFTSGTALLTDVTRQRAYDNQGTTPVELGNDADLDLGAGNSWSIRDDNDLDLFNVEEGSAGSTSTVTVGYEVDVYENRAVDVSFESGISVSTGSVAVSLGPDVLALTGVLSTSTGTDLLVSGGTNLLFSDGYLSGTMTPLLLASSSSDWQCFYDTFGPDETLLDALCQLSASNAVSGALQRTIFRAGTTGNPILADVNVTSPTNLDAALGDYSANVFDKDLNIYLNGVLLLPGLTAGDPNDVYPGDVASSGDLKFPYVLRTGSIIQMEIFTGTDPIS